MMYKGILVGFLIGALSCSFALAQTAPQDELVYRTKDGLEFHGWITRPLHAQKAPLILALPMRGSTHASFEKFVQSMRSIKSDSTWSQPYIVAFDLRGHGESTTLGSGTVSYRDMNQDEYQKIPNDVAEFTGWLLKDTTFKIDTTRMIVVGASIGANSAGILSGILPHLKPAHGQGPDPVPTTGDMTETGFLLWCRRQ